MSYLSFDEIATGVRALADTYGERCRLIELPNPSVEGRPVLALGLGDAVRGRTRRRSIYVGGVHAREWIPPDALLYLCADLLEARGAGLGLSYGGARIEADEVRRIFDRLRLVVLPCANPDGRVYSQEVDPDWRKNRRAFGRRRLRRRRHQPQLRRGLGFPPDLRPRQRQRLRRSLRQVRLRRAGRRVGAGDAQHRLAARAVSRHRTGSSISMARCRRSSTTGGSTRTRTTIPTQNFLQPGVRWPARHRRRRRVSRVYRCCGRVWSCVGCRELMAAEIDEGAERPLRRLGLLFALRNLRRERRLCL